MIHASQLVVVQYRGRIEEVILSIYKPDESHPRMLRRGSKALHLLQRVRDEAHRFAVDYHRKLRSKKMTRSILADVPGIGKKRRSALLKHFGSLKRIREATIEELEQAPTMTRPAAEAVYDYLRQQAKA